MLSLVWSKEKAVKEELINTFFLLYLNDKEYELSEISSTLVSLAINSTLSEMTSLEELLLHIIDWNSKIDSKEAEKKKNMYYFPAGVYPILWDKFSQGLQSQNAEDIPQYRAALQILRIAFARNIQIFQNKLEMFNTILFSFLKSKVFTLRFSFIFTERRLDRRERILTDSSKGWSVCFQTKSNHQTADLFAHSISRH